MRARGSFPHLGPGHMEHPLLGRVRHGISPPVDGGPTVPAEASALISTDTDRLPATRVGWGFVTLYALSYTGGSLLFLAPLLVSLALKVNDLVGIEAAPRNLAMVTGIGSLFSIVANPLFGRLSDRTTSRVGMRRPWMVTGVALGAVGTLVVAVAPDIATVLVGWCV